MMGIASFIGSGINGNGRVLFFPQGEVLLIASFIGSGINGNSSRLTLQQHCQNKAIASFIGSGINGNYSEISLDLDGLILESLLL